MKPIGNYSRFEEIQPSQTIAIHRLFGNPDAELHLGKKQLFMVEKAIVYSEACLLSLEGNLVKESTHWSPELSLLRAGKPPKRARDFANGLYVRLPSASYYHFIFESLPQLIWIKSKFPESTLVLNSRSHSYERAIASHLGMKVLFFKEPLMLEKTLLISQPGALGVPSDFEVRQLRTLSNAAAATQGEGKLFVSRRFASRSASDDKRAEQAAQSLGFEVVHFEKMSLLEQIELASQAQVMVGLHGAGLSNSVFMHRGSTLVEVLEPSWPNQCFEIMARAAELNFRRVTSSAKTPDSAIWEALEMAKEFPEVDSLK